VVVTHDEQVAARMRRQVRMLDGLIVSDTAAAVGSALPVAGDPIASVPGQPAPGSR
jgi:hypothetical protein